MRNKEEVEVEEEKELKSTVVLLGVDGDNEREFGKEVEKKVD